MSGPPGHCRIDTLELLLLIKSSPRPFLSAKHGQDEEHHETELLSAHQSSPNRDPLSHAEGHGGKLVGTGTAPGAQRFTVYQDRKPGHFLYETEAAGMWEIWTHPVPAL